ncbi:MAG: phosphohistidine phosphatase SixA, partial [bacterium]
AEETALILAEQLSPPSGVKAVQGLAPKDDVAPMAEGLESETGPVVLVGHLPFLSRLASLLLTGDAESPVVRFRMGGIVCLVRENGNWAVGWALTPDLL